MHAVLEREAAALRPGESGLLALDWWNGNRSVLVDVDLTGLLARCDAGDQGARDLPRAHRGDGLRHARRSSTPSRRPALPIERDRRLRRPAREEPAADADLRRCDRPRRSVSPRRARRPRSARRCSAAVAAGAAAGGYDSVVEAAARMARLRRRALRAQPASTAAVYDELYRRVPRAARLLRPGRERRDEAPQGDQGPDAHRAGVITPRRGGGRPRSIAARAASRPRWCRRRS